VDRHRLAVVVENDDLKEPAGPVGTDVEVTVALAHYADGVADCVLNILVGNTVLTGVVRDLLLCRLPCPPAAAQVTLRTPGTSVRTATHVRQDLITLVSLETRTTRRSRTRSSA
jgi:hypothetical protein